MRELNAALGIAGARRRMLPVLVEEVASLGSLATLVYVDLDGLDENAAPRPSARHGRERASPAGTPAM
jgi:hypothetical protein